MKLLRTHPLAGFLVLTLLGACFSPVTANGQNFMRRPGNWNNLESLTPGREIRVVMKDLKSYHGEFMYFSDDGITLRQSAGDQKLARKDVFRVSQNRGPNRRKRNALIGLVAGAGAGLVIGLTPYMVERNCTQGSAFHCGDPPNSHLLEALTPLGAAAGAGIGAAIRTGGWHDVYRAR